MRPARQCSTLSEYLKCVEAIRLEWNPEQLATEEIWFRGQKFSKWGLLPGLYRQDELARGYIEEDLIERFKVLAASMPGVPSLERDWEWYFLAQHHGLPTRLLDWTESSLVGLFFAVWNHIDSLGPPFVLEDQRRPRADPEYGPESPAVWVLEAGTMNANALGEDSDVVLVIGGERTNRYLNINDNSGSPRDEEITRNKSAPIAILPPRQNPRIVAQLGTFTVHGTDQRSIEIISEHKDSVIKLEKIEIDKANICKLWNEISTTGISKMVLFPELEYISKYLKDVCCRDAKTKGR